MIDIPDPLDQAFPLGDGVADVSADAFCPYCGERIDLAVDPGGGPVQDYVEDCPVCCRPWHVTVRWDHEGTAIVELRDEDEA